jgi:hypothetical protein
MPESKPDWCESFKLRYKRYGLVVHFKDGFIRVYNRRTQKSRRSQRRQPAEYPGLDDLLRLADRVVLEYRARVQLDAVAIPELAALEAAERATEKEKDVPIEELEPAQQEAEEAGRGIAGVAVTGGADGLAAKRSAAAPKANATRKEWNMARDHWINKVPITGSSGASYTVAQHRDEGYWACTCPRWKIKRECKHLDAMGLPGKMRAFQPPADHNPPSAGDQHAARWRGAFLPVLHTLIGTTTGRAPLLPPTPAKAAVPTPEEAKGAAAAEPLEALLARLGVNLTPARIADAVTELKKAADSVGNAINYPARYANASRKWAGDWWRQAAYRAEVIAAVLEQQVRRLAALRQDVLTELAAPAGAGRPAGRRPRTGRGRRRLRPRSPGRPGEGYFPRAFFFPLPRTPLDNILRWFTIILVVTYWSGGQAPTPTEVGYEDWRRGGLQGAELPPEVGGHDEVRSAG